MDDPDRRTLILTGLVLMAASAAPARAGALPHSRRRVPTEASFDLKALEEALDRDARNAGAWDCAAAHPGRDASCRSHLAAVAAEKRALHSRVAARASRTGALPSTSPPGGMELGRAQSRLVDSHRRTLASLRTAEARTAFAPVLAAATYHAGLLRTLQARGAAATA